MIIGSKLNVVPMNSGTVMPIAWTGAVHPRVESDASHAHAAAYDSASWESSSAGDLRAARCGR